MQDENSQTQSQNQVQSLNVSIQGSSDPLLERRIFGKVASAGRQLARVADVVEVLVANLEASAGSALNQEARESIDKFRDMRKAIMQEKSRNSAEQIMHQLAALRAADGEAYAALVPELRNWLDSNSL